MSTSESTESETRFWEKLGIPVCSLPEARKVIEVALDNQLVPCINGEAGIGKTHMLKQLAEDNGWDSVFLYLAHLEREDIGGIPYPVKNGSMAYEFLCEKSIKKIIDGDRPTLLALDEWNRGENPVMNAAFTLMEDRRFGSHKLPDHVHIVAAMNPSESNYLVNEAEKDPAFRRRLVMLAVQVNVSAFLQHAKGRGNFHPAVYGYLESQPQQLMDTQARDAGKLYANPAAWEKMSNILKTFDARKWDYVEKERMLLLLGSGILGMGVMIQFNAYLRDSATVINPATVVFGYDAGTKAKILHLSNVGNHGALSEACEAVSLFLVNARNDSRVIDDFYSAAESVAMFLADLPNEVTQSFFSKLGKHIDELGDEGVLYHAKLSESWLEMPIYADIIRKLNDGHGVVAADRDGDDKR